LSAISCAVTSQVAGLPLVETSTRRVRRPLATIRSRMKRNSFPFVSSVPTTSTTGGLAAPAAGRCLATAAILAGLTEAIRALDSIWALATGCDQRVGGAGLET